MKLAHELTWFAAGGLLGFIVDAGIVQLLVGLEHWNPYLARIPSFVAAASVTWWWNRSFTFAHRRHLPGGQEWLRWILVMSAGAVLNYGTYALTVALFLTVRHWPALGVAAGSLVAAMLNFSGARTVVFNASRKTS
jgi:putative flippase GtrA